MRHIFHPEAGAEFEEAADYYEERRKGLGRDFAAEVYFGRSDGSRRTAD